MQAGEVSAPQMIETGFPGVARVTMDGLRSGERPAIAGVVCAMHGVTC